MRTISRSSMPPNSSTSGKYRRNTLDRRAVGPECPASCRPRSAAGRVSSASVSRHAHPGTIGGPPRSRERLCHDMARAWSVSWHRHDLIPRSRRRAVRWDPRQEGENRSSTRSSPRRMAIRSPRIAITFFRSTHVDTVYGGISRYEWVRSRRSPATVGGYFLRVEPISSSPRTICFRHSAFRDPDRDRRHISRETGPGRRLLPLTVGTADGT